MSGSCTHCGGSFTEGARFCPTCGFLNSSESASWFDRVCAGAIDGVVLAGSLGLCIRFGLKWWLWLLAWLALIEIGYHLKGSIGKGLTGIRVLSKSRFHLFLRETIGKLASLATFGIGFLMILSGERLALHDYMAKTSVVRTGRSAPLRQALLALLILFAAGMSVFWFFRNERPNDHSSPKAEEAQSLDHIVSQIPAVATLYVHDRRGKSIGQGSGFLITSDGVGVTNFHVIKDAVTGDVKLGDGRLYHLLAIHAYDEDGDVAIFQLGRKTSSGIEKAKDLPYLRLATRQARIGDHIATVGSPEGLSNSVSDGLVSNLRGTGDDQVLQITAPISPGSSGGPVFNLQGEVVAITSFQFTEGQNLNFAIPIAEVLRIKDLRADLPLEDFHQILRASNASRSSAKQEPAGIQESTASSAKSAPLLGTFAGTVHNLTADSRANSLVVIEEHEGTLQGCFAVRQPLFGSGPLQGSIDGNAVQFDVVTSSFHLRFEGVRSGKTLSGTYTALPQGGTEQQGEFVFEWKDSKRFKNFDPQTDCPTDADMNH
jgi:S1-C subfamily serine protease